MHCYILFLLIILTLPFYSISAQAEKKEVKRMEYNDFLFDMKELVDQEVNIRVPVLMVDVVERQVIPEGLKFVVNIANLERQEIKDIDSICTDFTVNCFIDVKGKLKKEMYQYVIDAKSVSTLFKIGISVSETGRIAVNLSEELANLDNVLINGGLEEQISGYLWIEGRGKLVVAYGYNIKEFYGTWTFDTDADNAKKVVLDECNKAIFGVLKLSSKCKATVYDVPWW